MRAPRRRFNRWLGTVRRLGSERSRVEVGIQSRGLKTVTENQVVVFDMLNPLGSRFYLFIYCQLDNGTHP